MICELRTVLIAALPGRGGRRLAEMLGLARRLPLLAAACRHPRLNVAPLACAAPQLNAWLDTTLANEQRRRISLAKEAEAALKAEKLAKWANLVVANLYRIDDRATNVVVEDWEAGGQQTELHFDSTAGTPREQADAAFAKARKLRRGSAIVSDLIERSEVIEGRLRVWQERLRQLSMDDDNDALRILRQEVVREAKKLKLKATELELSDTSEHLGKHPAQGRRGSAQAQPLWPSNTPGWGGREFVSPSGVPILVGRNRKDNEQLSLSVAREPDVWMHVRGIPGAHVLLQMSRVKGRSPPSDACLQMAADLAAFYSEARDDRKVLVTLASPRHVTKPNGAPLGAVKLRKEEGTLVGRPTDSVLIPRDVMEARERER